VKSSEVALTNPDDTATRKSTGGPGIMQLTVPTNSSDRAWLALRLALWPDASEAEHLAGMADFLARGYHVRLATAGGSTVGFVEASKRVDHVNGTSSSPVAFLEGLYVAQAARRKGVARALVESVVA
jgi:aminoglycoside 6'-N-acetyltransferase I